MMKVVVNFLRSYIAMLLLTVSVIIFVSHQPLINTMQNRIHTGSLYASSNNPLNQSLQQSPVQNLLNLPTNRLNEHLEALGLHKPELPGINKTGRYVSLCDRNLDGKRTGNQLFNFAAMVKVANVTGRRVAMIAKHPYGWLEQFFEVPITRVESIEKELCPCVVIEEGPLKTFNQREDLVGKSLLLYGLWQNWKFTEGIETQLRYYLRFRPVLIEKVQSYFRKKHPSHWREDAKPFRVGIHVRAGDIMNSRQFNYGFTIPQPPYFKKAMNYVINDVARPSRATNEKLLVHFYVTSDSIDWVISTMELTSIAYSLAKSSANVNVHVTYSTNNTAAVDLALLSSCDAVIMSTGTYGWWAGWLSNKTTIYYHDWPRPGSHLNRDINRAEFYPPWWVSFSGPFFKL